MILNLLGTTEVNGTEILKNIRANLPKPLHSARVKFDVKVNNEWHSIDLKIPKIGWQISLTPSVTIKGTELIQNKSFDLKIKYTPLSNSGEIFGTVAGKEIRKSLTTSTVPMALAEIGMLFI